MAREALDLCSLVLFAGLMQWSFPALLPESLYQEMPGMDYGILSIQSTNHVLSLIKIGTNACWSYSQKVLWGT